MTPTETILTAITASGVSSTALAWLLKAWIGERLKHAVKHEYDERLAAYTAQLTSQNDIAIERLKADLEIAAASRSVQFAALHERRAAAIEKLYVLLNEVMGSASFAIAMAERRGSWADYSKAGRELSKFFHQSELYFSASLAGQIGELIHDIGWPQGQQTYIIELSTPEEQNLLREDLIHNWHKVEPDLRKAKSSIEAEFRRLIGVESENNAA